MNQGRKRSSQKQFMQTMIITGVLGLTIMMVVTLYMIKLFGPKKQPAVVQDPLRPIVGDQIQEDIEGQKLSGVVHELGSKKTNIKIWNIKEKEHTKLYIKDRTQIADSYGKPMSIHEIGLGDIVELTYEANKREVLTIQKSAKAWTKTNISGIAVNIPGQTIQVGNTKYDYTSDIMVINGDLEEVDLKDINDLDTLVIKGIDNTIWSVQVVQSAGYLKLINIPTTKGTVEIGNNIVYRLEEVEENIPLPGGKHKIVIRMEGYEPFVKHIQISTNDIQELDLKEIETTIANLKIRVVNSDVDYKVLMDHKTYKKDEVIMVQPGLYTLKVIAEGFKTVEMDIELEEGNRRINISLVSEEEEEDEEKDKDNEEKPDKDKKEPDKKEPDKAKPKPVTEEEKPVEEIKTVQIIIETDPTGAQVFVGGVNKGSTPALTSLKPGEYSISIEKEGYSPLYSTIIIDASNAQKGFLYTLQEE